MKKETATVYITSDKKKFLDKEEARKHQKKLDNTKAYRVHCSVDPGTGEYRIEGYLIICSEWNHEKWVEKWLYDSYGNRVTFLSNDYKYQDYPVWAWEYEEVKPEEVESEKILEKIDKFIG